MIHNLFPNEVYLEPIEHKYFDSNGNRYISFSVLYGKLVEKFDADKIASNYKSMSKSEVLAMWQANTDNGTRIDKALETYAQEGIVEAGNEDIAILVKDVLEKYKIYNSTYEQGIPYCKDFMVAGSWDKLSIVSNRKDSRFHLSDFKCFEKGEQSLYSVKGQAWLNKPFQHLANTKYTKISFQLSFYAYLFEKLTGRKCERLFIDLIVPVCEKGKVISYTNQVVPVIYLKNDVIKLLEHFKIEIKNMLSDTVDVLESADDEIF